MINEGHYKTDVGLQRRRFSLIEVYMQIINEVLDLKNIEDYEIVANSDGWEFDALIQNEYVKVYVYVEPTSMRRFNTNDKFKDADNIWNFGFEIGPEKKSTQFKKTTYREYIKIIATVYKILKKFIQINDPNIITLFSEEKHGGTGVDAQKDDIYFSALNKNTISGYDLEDIYDNIDKKKGIMLFKRNSFK